MKLHPAGSLSFPCQMNGNSCRGITNPGRGNFGTNSHAQVHDRTGDLRRHAQTLVPEQHANLHTSCAAPRGFCAGHPNSFLTRVSSCPNLTRAGKNNTGRLMSLVIGAVSVKISNKCNIGTFQLSILLLLSAMSRVVGPLPNHLNGF